MTHKRKHKPHTAATLTLGPRLRHDIDKRIHEIESRWPGARSVMDWAELARLRELIKAVKGGGYDQ